jgi:hypothetical protein
MYTAWNIRKERNRRIYKGRNAPPQQVFRLIKDKMDLRSNATGSDVPLQKITDGRFSAEACTEFLAIASAAVAS